MFDLQKTNPEVNEHRVNKVGLYIETKNYGWYLKTYGLNLARMLFDTLSKFNLETVDKCKDVLPIIVECFEAPSLKYFGTLDSDLPLIYLMSDSNST